LHRLAAASKQTGGITFTNKDGNIVTADNEDTEEEAMEDEPIPIPIPTTNIENNQAITGVEEDYVLEENQIEENDNIRPEPENNTKNNDTHEEITGVTEENNTVPIPEEEKDPDEYVTLEDINITSEMNIINRLPAETEDEEASEISSRTNE